MEQFLNFQVIWDNFTYFMIGRFPNGPLGGVGLTIYLAVVSCILSFFGGLILGLLSISRHRWIAWPMLRMPYVLMALLLMQGFLIPRWRLRLSLHMLMLCYTTALYEFSCTAPRQKVNSRIYRQEFFWQNV